ncbi:MAG: hypothetical protein LUG52_05225, partial [Clostridia bacterium]|nr:hypothetical protein [Clostridia bacterium]
KRKFENLTKKFHYFKTFGTLKALQASNLRKFSPATAALRSSIYFTTAKTDKDTSDYQLFCQF